jgi:NAD(P)-dependent dehydrogenase (short-subunit alcohol dehydrogenase family)
MTADTLSLKGKTALVTGSGRENGIGAAIARAFARNVAADLSREFGTKTTVVQGAVEKASNATKIVKETLEGLGASQIDILGMYLFH